MGRGQATPPRARRHPSPHPQGPKRHRERKPFAGLTTKPHCDAVSTPATSARRHPPPPPRLVPTRGERRQVRPSTHFCPRPGLCLSGRVGWGNLRANGHPNGGPWRQLLMYRLSPLLSGDLGTLLHGKRGSVELIVRVIASVAEGPGHPGTARVFEIRPEARVLQKWLVGRGGAAAGLLPVLPARRARHAGAAR